MVLTSRDTVEVATPTSLAIEAKLRLASIPLSIAILSSIVRCLFFPFGMVASFPHPKVGKG